MWPLPHFLKGWEEQLPASAHYRSYSWKGLRHRADPKAQGRVSTQMRLAPNSMGTAASQSEEGDLWTPPPPHTRQLSNWKSKRSVCVESRQTHSHFQTVGPAFPLPPATGLNSHWLGSRPALPAPWGRLPLWPHLEATAGSSSGSGKLPATASVLPNPPFHILFLNFLRMISSSGFWSFF